MSWQCIKLPVCVCDRRIEGTTRIRYVEIIRTLFASQVDYVSVHGSFPSALGYRAAVSR